MESKHCTVDFSSPPLGPEMNRIYLYVRNLPLPPHIDRQKIEEKLIGEYVVSRSKEYMSVQHQKGLCLFLLGKHSVYFLPNLEWLRVLFTEAKEAGQAGTMAFISPFNGVPGVAEFVRSMFNKYKEQRLSLAKRTSPKLHPFLTLDDLEQNIIDFGMPYPIRDNPDEVAGQDMATGFVSWLSHGDTTYIPYVQQNAVQDREDENADDVTVLEI